jgi:hypothetical protein
MANYILDGVFSIYTGYSKPAIQVISSGGSRARGLVFSI